MPLPSFLRRSLRHTVTALVLATTLTALLVAGGALFVVDARQHRENRLNELRTQAEVLGRASAAALLFRDRRVAQENLDIMKVLPGVDAAALYLADGSLFAAYREPGFEVPARAPPPGTGIDNNRLRFAQVIEDRGEAVGTLLLDGSYGLAERMRSYLGILGLVTVASLAAAWLLSVWLQRAVTGPILEVTRAARRVVQDGDYTVRVLHPGEQHELGLLADAFNRMLDEISRRSLELQEGDRKKDLFLATLAHELRNPLAPLLSSVGVLRRVGGSDPREVWARDVIERQVRHMARLLDDLLDVGRITSNKLEIRRQRVSLRAVVEAAVETSRPVMEQARHRFRLELPAREIYLDGDPVRLAQVFSNLLNNAARYTNPGGDIALTAQHEGSTVCVTVRDTGIGIAAEDVPQMFEIFSQSKFALERGQGGLGIGLFLVRSLVQMHGGSIQIESEGPGRGTAVLVRLPELDTTQPLPLPSNGFDASETASRIVVADDNVDAVESMATLLRSVGHEVRVAHDGLQAVAAVAEFRPAVVLLDIGMPGLSGYEAARLIRSSEGGRDILLIAVTGWGKEEDRRKAFDAGFDNHFTKPAHLDEIEALISMRRREPGGRAGQS